MKLVLIGGGENGRPGKPYETKLFDEKIVELTNKKTPQLLFIGFTQKSLESAEDYFQIIKSNFDKLGCACEHLREIELSDSKTTQDKILRSDIIYVGGGNTLRLMNLLRKYKVDKLLKDAGDKGTVLCGVSAGAICWCNYGNSDSRRFTSNSTQLIRVTGLGFVDALFCPHYDVESARQEDLKRMMKTTKGVALAFENCTALQITDGEYQVLKAKDNANAWKCYWQKGEYVKKPILDCSKIECLTTKYSVNLCEMPYEI